MDENTLLSTSSLFHYTNRVSLNKILESRVIKPCFSLEKFYFNSEKIQSIINFLGLDVEGKKEKSNLIDEAYIAMVCFCDIPANLTANHIKVYDNYAIGLSKEWGCSAGVSPVIYYPNSGGTKSLIERLIYSYNTDFIKIKDFYERKFEEEFFDKDGVLLTAIMNTYNTILDLFFYAKPYQGDYLKRGVLYKDYKYYDEREWRYIPNNILCKNYVNKVEFEGPDFIYPELYPLSFEVSDITDILVPLKELEQIKKTISKIPEMAGFDISKIKPFEV